MSPEERVAGIRLHWVHFGPEGKTVYHILDLARMTAEMEDAIREAVLEEREACARVAESPDLRCRDTDETMEGIAAAIRARSGDAGPGK